MQTKTTTYTVSEVNALVKEVLETSLPGRLTVQGEITGWKQHHSGHCYFSLKDEDSVLPCAMWRSNAANLKFRPENGLAVLATGFVDVYVPQGRYNFVVSEMHPAGVGALQLAYEQMVKKLRGEGLFDDEHKKPIPAFPERIGILTSESGAAVHDIADSVHQRWPCTKLCLYPVPVQGEGAADKIAAAITDLNRRNKRLKLDLLIVGRGGGSLEDLWAFNEEVLARAIFASRIPIISAVGHEVDVTVADFVADARASTPTKAGVVAVPDMRDVLADLVHQQRRLAGQARACLDLSAQHLQTVLASAVFRNPLLPIRHREQHIDELTTDLAEAMRERLDEGRADLQTLYEQVVKIEPHRLLGRWAVVLGELQSRSGVALQRRVDRAALGLDQMTTRCNTALTAVMNGKRMQLAAQEGHLAGLDPRSVLQRGYSITTNERNGRVVRTADDVEVGDSLVTELAHEAKIESKVTGKPERQRRSE
ncbi:MAG: exodeoxyribonuclease VII large subunit [Phycisphaerales bacterium]|nr:MAG: exodeoxyribonuclease VII large subunit [Phycisphaerales bacterium]